MPKKLKDTIYKLESSLLQAQMRKSLYDMDRLLAEDFKEFGSSGEIYDKGHILEHLHKNSKTELVQFVLSDFEVREIVKNIVLATFKIDKTFSDKTHAVSLRSSLWKKNDENWQMIFHQGTPIKHLRASC